MGSSLQKIESRVEKGAVMIACSVWLACLSLSNPTCFSPTYQMKNFRRICHKQTKEFVPFCMIEKEWLDRCMDVCSSYKYGSDIGLERLSYQSQIISINIRISPLLSKEKVKDARLLKSS